VRIRVKETKNIFKINLNFGRQHFLAAFDTEFGVIKTRFRIPLSIGAKKNSANGLAAKKSTRLKSRLH
jgi:hypothetical protein